MADLFISYSQPDRDCALELVGRLESEGFGCWIAPRDVAPAADWAEEIIDAIAAARMMILVFSGNSNQSSQVRREVERAANKQRPILPFRIEDVLPSKSLEYFLSAQHWLDAFPAPREPHYARLCAYLKTHLGAAARPASIADVSGTYTAIAAKTRLFHADDLRQIESTLAQYIGPLPKHLVRRAAPQASSLEDLIARLAVELDAETDRHRFSMLCRAACRQGPS